MNQEKDNKGKLPKEQGATWAELCENNQKLMNDPVAQKQWAEELEKQGFVVNFSGPIPSIWAKEIYVTEPSPSSKHPE